MGRMIGEFQQKGYLAECHFVLKYLHARECNKTSDIHCDMRAYASIP